MPNILKKPSKPSKKSATPDNPTHQTTETGAESDRDSKGEHLSRDLRANKAYGADPAIASGINHGGGSQTVIQDGRIGDQQLPAPGAPTLAPGYEGGGAGECSRMWLLGGVFIVVVPLTLALPAQEHSNGGSAETRNEQLGRDLRSAERNPNLGEREDQGPGVQQPSETAPGRASGGQDGEGVRNLVQPGRSRGKSWHGCIAVRGY